MEVVTVDLVMPTMKDVAWNVGVCMAGRALGRTERGVLLAIAAGVGHVPNPIWEQLGIRHMQDIYPYRQFWALG